ncbi:MAG: hypothetical protein KDA96_10435 [Planctomycetaceae bacterium]|nr:hypothetical protein [Planctomycetaceae bacterium]
MVTGFPMMIGPVVWFAGGLAVDRISFYPPFLPVAGIVAVVTGIRGTA